MESEKKIFHQALAALVRYQARRDHSQVELRTKLSRRYPKEAVEWAIEEAREKRWLMPEGELAARAAASLARRGRSHMEINLKLKRRGLPPQAKDRDAELEKGRALVQTKFGKADNFDRDEVPRVIRFLRYRGFDHETIRRVIYEKP